MRCESCGSSLGLGPRHARRVFVRGQAHTCRTCRGQARNEPREADFRWIAERFGIPLQPGVPARDTLAHVVTASAAPPELARVLDALSNLAK